MAKEKDYYKILGVEKNATKEDIKKAYKKLAKQYHPDVSKDSDATERFKEINEAAAVLGDDEKRTKYDQFGSTYEQFSGGRGFDFSDLGGGFESVFDFGDIFDQFFGGGFGGRRRASEKRGTNLRYDMEITLEEASEGVIKIIEIPRLERCDKCNGSGAKSESDIVECPSCGGSGMVRKTQRTPFGMFSTTTSCRKCRGSGRYIKEECPNCDGTGVVKKTRKIEIKIPAGAEEGTNLHLRGEGEAGEKGGREGDLFIVIHVKEHDIFERKGDDIFVDIKIPFTTATLGGEVEVPTLKGKAKLKIPSGTQSGTQFKMRGLGIPYLHGDGKGDELVKVEIDVPTKLNAKQKKLLQEFEKEYDKQGFLKSVFR
ncbi:MAG: molecular chaperone DnaJ [Nanoarchaeota archaeon]